MTTRDQRAIQARIDAIEWYHEFDFGDGLMATTRSDVESHRNIWRFIEANLATVDFAGKSVLDIGAWDGYWSYHAERRGARSVLATDDISQNWAAGTGIHLAKELLGSRVEINQQTSVYNLASLGCKFDIILYLGVYYHLHDPFYAFSQIRHCCHADTLVLIDGPIALGMPRAGAVVDFTNHAAEFLPNREGLQQLTDAAYFRTTAQRMLFGDGESSPGQLGWRWRLRHCWQALRGDRARLWAMLDKVAASDRIFLKCRPFVGCNTIHDYPPPFGLHEYDERFRNRTKGAA